MDIPPWATGPAEIHRHGIELLKKDSDVNRRLALINIDNSVELMMQTYITLPRRVTGIDISRKKRDEYCLNFPSLLDGVEETAPKKIIGIDLGMVEWFHRLRNELYHQGNGLTVEREKVEAYAEIAELLFKGLFDVQLDISISDSADRLGRFLQAWIRIERAVVGVNALRQVNFLQDVKEMLEGQPDSEKIYDELIGYRKMRNMLVHGEEVPTKALSEERLHEVEAIAERLERLQRNG